MKFKAILTIALVFSVALIPISCNDTFLELHNKGAISEVNALETIEDMETALNGVYATYRGWAGVVISSPEYLVDDFFALKGFTNKGGGVQEWNFGSDDVGYIWGTAYALIIRASKIINKIDNGFSEGTLEQRNHIYGQAVFARAMAHFELVRAYSKTYNPATAATDLGVPIITEGSLDFPARKKVQEVYDFILSEMAKIIDGELIGANDNTKFSMEVVYAFMSRLYLERGEYDNVILYSTKVIDSGKYKLAKSKADLQALWVNDEHEEIIWKVAVTTQDGGPALGAIWNNGQVGNDPRPDYAVSPGLTKLYDNADIRYDVYFMDNVSTSSAGRQTIITKYPTNPQIAILNVNMPKLYRIAEQYLNRAEAYEALGKTAEAQADLDAILTARGAKALGDNLRDQIRTERRREFVGEGIRFFDLKRWKTGFYRETNDGCILGCNLTVSGTKYQWVFPIPPSEMIANKNMEQNEGYSN